MDDYFEDMPCRGINEKFDDLSQSLEKISTSSLSAKLIQAFLKSYANSYKDLSEKEMRKYPPNIALGALFDLTVSTKYANELIVDDGFIVRAKILMITQRCSSLI